MRFEVEDSRADPRANPRVRAPTPKTRSTSWPLTSSLALRSVDLIVAFRSDYFGSRQFDLLFFRIFVYEKISKKF